MVVRFLVAASTAVLSLVAVAPQVTMAEAAEGQLWVDNTMELIKANAILAAHGSTTRTSEDSDTQQRWKYSSKLSQDRRRSKGSFLLDLHKDLLTLFGEDKGEAMYELWSHEFHDYILGHPSHMEPLEMKDEDTPYGHGGDKAAFDDPKYDSYYGYGEGPPPPPKVYIDKYARELLSTVNDPDCTTSAGEIDVASPDFSVERAVQVWHKCRYLVLRNILSPEVAVEFRNNVTKFVYDLKEGKINHEGTTSYREPYFIHEVESLRWDMLLPKKYAQNEEVMAHPKLMDILSDERILGEQQKCLAYGMVMAEPTAKSQGWHTDTPGLFHDSFMLDAHNFNGHEMPTASIVMFSPLLQRMEPRHGPTQFCVGSVPLNGINWANGMMDPSEGGWHKFLDESVRDELLDLGGGPDLFDQFTGSYCPPKMWRSLAHVNAGDMVLWDYATIHRAGPNHSDDFRSAIYVSYSRNLVKDLTFEGYRKGELPFEATSGLTGRFALPNDNKDGVGAQDGVDKAQTCNNPESECQSPSLASLGTLLKSN